MPRQFVFLISDEEKQYLRDLVRRSIASGLSGEEAQPPEPPTDKLRESLGAFVTLTRGGQLRGCIGNVQGSGEVWRTVWEMARAAAFSDPRFPPLKPEEFEDVEWEISIISPIEPCRDVNEIVVGKHGLIVQRGGHSGLLLPQVPVEWGWSREQFLRQTCVKAGLAENSWNKAGTNLYWFEAEVF
ncbi:MAG: AmmeMemoRadiSam system protein A [Desulfovibrio sp.]|jgi:AmmeMemoRadiSam system protein A|nr:AmmeMemoRadiSam system protein A [Desulfovibrio sp.]